MLGTGTNNLFFVGTIGIYTFVSVLYFCKQSNLQQVTEKQLSANCMYKVAIIDFFEKSG